ncbi:helix-turn-helix domain-containing protein [Leisingera sp.]|uniref:helix-turn-helix domain-containing protein n=1 Tax=Leisingera sp. TaxID=1879318 RepID=UPI003A5BEE9F
METHLRRSCRCSRRPEHANRAFRRAFGALPAQWRKQRRLDQAKGLLESTGDAITSIGLAVGYEGTPNFISAFR